MRLKTGGLIVMGMMALAGADAAQADSLLGVSPLRVILTDTKTSEILSLSNRSNETHSYKLVAHDEVMNEQGNLIKKDDFPYSAKRMLRYMPRQITLKAGEHQNVRVMAMPTEGLAEGEYHTHLIFDEVITPSKAEDTKVEKGFKMRMVNAYSVGIPVIYQHGKMEAALKADSARLMVNKDGQIGVDLSMTHTGNAEVTAIIRLVAADKGAENLIQPRTMNVYREAGELTVRMMLLDTVKDSLQALKAKNLQVIMELEGHQPQVVTVTD